ncbi:MAG: hypothetical protein QOI62_2994 [Solirubrobacteraceae bacterium]|jgi:muconolactone D-isomerase|nr:hypothetical protein [Solirubrobacteraceae bacterium]MEA2394201.1 hypothetical protein [Solirubrobacteraceae bacterium]
MLYLVRFDVHQPESMPTERLWEIWNEEAKAALGAKAAGAIVDLWKVAGQRTVFALCDFPDHRSLDEALSGLPIVGELRGGVHTQAFPVYPYENFAEALRATVEGG